MQHGFIVIESYERPEMTGAAVWDFAVGEGQQVTVYTAEYLWGRPFGPSPVRSIGSVRTAPRSNCATEHARCAPEWRDEFLAICHAFRLRPALVMPDVVPDAEAVRMFETFWSLYPDLGKTLVAGRPLRKHLQPIRSPAPWVYVYGFAYESPESFFLSDDSAAVDSAHELFELVPDVVLGERW